MTNVWHVLELKKNLISLDTLDFNGCRCTAEGGVIEVSKSVLVVMRGQHNGNLYVLQGSTVLGATTVSSSTDSNFDITHLWHTWLGHLSERGMTEFSKQGLLSGQRIGKLDFCEHYVFGKQCNMKFSLTVHRTKSTMNYIHSNL